MKKKKLRYYLCVVLACAVVGSSAGLMAAAVHSRRESAQLPATEITETQSVPAQTLSLAEPNRDDWRLTLANPWNAVPEDFSVELADLGEGQFVDERCYFDLMKMMADCRDAGQDPVIVSSYRSQEKQQALFENKVMRVMAEGYSEEEASVVAAREVAMPGTSEHQLGLAVDIVHNGNWNLDESQEDTPTQQWLMENSWRYGFILRYPNDKSGVTGIIYEPWHYRYVGREHAKAIFEQGICLEEYLENPTA